jgi:hypothetical protein
MLAQLETYTWICRHEHSMKLVDIQQILFNQV